MILTGQSFSSFDERTLGDSTARSPNFAIELNHTSFGSLSAGDLKDYYAITPGAGDFALFVTTDPANGFTTQAFNFDFLTAPWAAGSSCDSSFSHQGGSNALGICTEVRPDAGVEGVGVEPAGGGLDTPDHAATMTLGTCACEVCALCAGKTCSV